MKLTDEQIDAIKKEFRTIPVDGEGHALPIYYDEHYVRGTVLKLLFSNQAWKTEAENLRIEVKSHAPEGRNYTNQQYVELLLKCERLENQLDSLSQGADIIRGSHHISSPYLSEQKVKGTVRLK